jgi:S-adenosylmethionine:tRNA ribosyltransferase-isomerase
VTPTLLGFTLPSSLEAAEPPEARGVPRDEVRLMVASRASGKLIDTTFRHLPEFLEPGDLLVVNTSATIPAALDVLDPREPPIVLHLSTQLDDGTWVVEPRRGCSSGSERWSGPPPPHRLSIGEDAVVELRGPYLGSARLWIARVVVPGPLLPWLEAHGRPIRYGYVRGGWPIAAYQNVYATEPGSAEMPSAGRPLTARVITALVAKGVGVTPIVLHTGVASLEAGETPYPERVTVPAWTAARVNAVRAGGGRVIAVGTTVVRALESAATEEGSVHELDGWTDLVITPARDLAVVDGLVTGWHEPETSHLQMLEALAGPTLLERSYTASVARGYLWHEFGDSHLILP